VRFELEAVFKRHNIVEEQDLKPAVQVLNQVRKEAEMPPGAAGPDSASVDQK